MELQQKLVKKANNKEAYDEIANQIFTLREKRQQASIDTVQRNEQLQRRLTGFHQRPAFRAYYL